MIRKSVLWGHHYDEYCDMFALDDHHACGSILDVGSGPNAVNVERKRVNQRIVSVDPLFCETKQNLERLISKQFNERVAEIKARPTQFDFSQYGGLESTISRRENGMALFLSDYEHGVEEGRYRCLQGVQLPFSDFEFDLALSSHYFFREPGRLSLDEHVALLKEMMRVSREVRVFPLIDKDGTPSPLLGPVILALHQLDARVEVKDVAYHVQPKGNAMLSLALKTCPRPGVSEVMA